MKELDRCCTVNELIAKLQAVPEEDKDKKVVFFVASQLTVYEDYPYYQGWLVEMKKGMYCLKDDFICVDEDELMNSIQEDLFSLYQNSEKTDEEILKEALDCFSGKEKEDVIYIYIEE